MIGPVIPPQIDPSNRTIQFEAGDSRLSVTLIPSVYTPGFIKGDSIPGGAPHAILCLNAGLMSIPQWQDFLKIIGPSKVPVLVSEPFEFMIENIKKGLGVKREGVLNPFRCPLRLWAPDNHFAGFWNGWILRVI